MNYQVPEGYALVSIEALRTLGVLDQLQESVVYPTAQAQVPAPATAALTDAQIDYIATIFNLTPRAYLKAWEWGGV